MKGKPHWNKGGHLTEKTKQKMSLIRRGIPRPWMRRDRSEEEKRKLSEASKLAWETPEIRKKYHDALQQTQWLKVRTDKGQLELIEKWHRLGFEFEPNYQVRTTTDLFYVDGYDSIHNVILEYDGKYHLKPGQKDKDETRQQKIIKTLNPKKFWRYDSVNKTFHDIIGHHDGE